MSEENKLKSNLDPKILEILVCPACKTDVMPISDSLQCRNPGCRRRYEIKDGIPIMLIEESKIIPPKEFETLGLSAKD